MDWKGYEDLVRDLLREMSTEFADMVDVALESGEKSKITGASDYKHQIDVSLRTNHLLMLVECKFWKKRIKPREILVLAARLEDIRDAVKDSDPERQVLVSLATTMGSSSNARKLARYFHINLDHVQSKKQYVLRLRDHVKAKQHDQLLLSDDFTTDVKRGSGSEDILRD